MKHLDLFSGIGGFALAARWMGWETVGFCEIDEYCRKVLRKHWPGVPIVRDIRYLAEHAESIRGCADIVTGGVPCQDVSPANKTKTGFRQGTRSGLVTEFLRVASEAGARWIVFENAATAITTYRDELMPLFQRSGYDAEPMHLGDGSLHSRERSFVVAHSHGMGSAEKVQRVAALVSDQERKRSASEPAGLKFLLRDDADPVLSLGDKGHRLVAPVFCRAPDAIPNRVDRLRALGNAVVPTVAYMVLRAIQEADQ